MKIVVLDGYTLNPGDLSWTELEALGPCTVHSSTPPNEIVPRSRGAEILLTNKTPLDDATLRALPEVKYIGVLATGHNVVNSIAARRQGIPVSNVPAYGTRSVAQHVMALLLELTQRVGDHARAVQRGQWARCPDFCFWETPLIELDGLTLGIVGSGRIGRAVGELGRAFGMQVIFASRAGGRAELERVLRESDVISLHCPLTADTAGLINANTIGWMKPTVFLINTARGPLVNEADLAQALNEGRIAGAALDVLQQEPPPANHPLISARNILITPHLAWATRSARQRLLHTAVENVRAFLSGRPQNVVN